MFAQDSIPKFVIQRQTSASGRALSATGVLTALEPTVQIVCNNFMRPLLAFCIVLLLTSDVGPHPHPTKTYYLCSVCFLRRSRSLNLGCLGCFLHFPRRSDKKAISCEFWGWGGGSPKSAVTLSMCNCSKLQRRCCRSGQDH